MTTEEETRWWLLNTPLLQGKCGSQEGYFGYHRYMLVS